MHNLERPSSLRQSSELWTVIPVKVPICSSLVSNKLQNDLSRPVNQPFLVWVQTLSPLIKSQQNLLFFFLKNCLATVSDIYMYMCVCVCVWCVCMHAYVCVCYVQFFFLLTVKMHLKNTCTYIFYAWFGKISPFLALKKHGTHTMYIKHEPERGYKHGYSQACTAARTHSHIHI